MSAWRWAAALALCLLVWAAVAASAALAPVPAACTPRVLAVSMARADLNPQANGPQGDAGLDRPDQGWVSVALPNDWSRTWPDHQGAVWYRVDWERGCTDPTIAPTDRKFNRMRPSMARVLGLETRSAKEG